VLIKKKKTLVIGSIIEPTKWATLSVSSKNSIITLKDGPEPYLETRKSER